MTNLVKDEPRQTRGAVVKCAFPIAASTTIFNGSAIQESSAGSAEIATGVASTFLGIAEEQQANPSTIDDNIRIVAVVDGEVLLFVASASTLARTDLGATVYCLDGNSFTLVSTSAQAIGKVTEVPADAVGAASGYIWVKIQGAPWRSI